MLQKLNKKKKKMHALTFSDEEGLQSSHPLGLATSEVSDELGNDTELNDKMRALRHGDERGVFKRIYRIFSIPHSCHNHLVP
jgi:hypothetical protein